MSDPLASRPSSTPIGWGGRFSLTLFVGSGLGVLIFAMLASGTQANAFVGLSLVPFLIGNYWTAGVWTRHIGIRILLSILLTVGMLALLFAIFFAGCLVILMNH